MCPNGSIKTESYYSFFFVVGAYELFKYMIKKNTVFIFIYKIIEKMVGSFGYREEEKSLNFRLLWEIIGFLL